MRFSLRFTLILLFSLSFFSCRKKDDPAIKPTPNPPVDTTSQNRNLQLRIDIQNSAGNQPLTLENGWYLTENGDSIQINEYKYYLSNFILIGDSVRFSERESYYVVDQSDAASQRFIMDSIPAGIYKKISFLIGVDPERNTSGAQTGALDPIHGMFWD